MVLDNAYLQICKDREKETIQQGSQRNSRGEGRGSMGLTLPQLYSDDGEFCKLVFASLNISLLTVDTIMVSECKRMVYRKSMQDKSKN